MSTQRTLEELEQAVYEASEINNVAELKQYIKELENLASSKAEALVIYAKASIELAENRYAASLELYLKAVGVFTALSDKLGMAYSNNGAGSSKYNLNNYPEAMEYYERSLEFYEELGNKSGLAKITGNIALVYWSISNYPQALENHERALALYEELGEKSGIARVTGNLGNVYHSIGNYPQALENYERVLALHEELGEKSGIARVIGNIGNVYRSIGNYPQALEYFERALALHEELGEKSGIARVTGNLGNVYYSIGSYPQAIEYYERALEMYEELGAKSGIARVTGNIGSIYGLTGSNPQALEYYERALALLQELGENSGIAFVTGNIAEVHLKMSHYEAALTSAQRSLTINKELHLIGGSAYAVCLITQVYVDTGDIERAEESIATIDGIEISEPGFAIDAEHARYAIQINTGDITAATASLNRALELARKHGLKSEEAETHKLFCDLAQKQNDFAGYIEHNNEYSRITEEINGKEATTKLAIQAKEREIRKEREERERERAVLYSTLPKVIADRIVKGEKVTGDHFEHAAVLFTDIVGFTSHSSNLHPQQVTEFLAQIYAVFDKLCEQHAVTKVKTIGDSYMCFKGDGEAKVTANSIAEVAFGIINSNFTWPVSIGVENQASEPVQFRVGVAMGPVTAGVIGTDRLQYDIWGDTVNLASRMESTSEPGRIQVNETFAKTLASLSLNLDHYTLKLRGTVEVKGKGAVQTWWLEKNTQYEDNL